MYEYYEDPYELEQRLEEFKEQLAQCGDNDSEREWLVVAIADLQERINSAGQMRGDQNDA